MTNYIYKIMNKINNKIYIGKRITNHKIENDTYFGSGTLLKMAIKKHGKENFSKEIIEICDTEKILNEREIYWISKINSFSPNGYNINIGGKGGDNFTKNPNKEILREKFKKQQLGKKATAETKLKMSQTRLGKSIKPTFNVTCPHCSKIGDKRNMVRWHFENCVKNLKNKNNKNVLSSEGTCPFCNKDVRSVDRRFHFDFCRNNPNRIIVKHPYRALSAESLKKANNTKKERGTNIKTIEQRKKISDKLKNRIFTDEHRKKIGIKTKERSQNSKIIYICSHCKKETKSIGNYKRWHENNCRLKQKN